MTGEPEKKNETGCLSRFAMLGTALVPFAKSTLLVLLLIFFICNFDEISRLIGQIQAIDIPGGIKLTLQNIRLPDGDSGPRHQKWATYKRVSKVKISRVKLDDDKKAYKKCPHPKYSEWVEIRAKTEPLYLAGGYIGDSSEMLLIPEDTPVLPAGECIRIVTFGQTSPSNNDTCKVAVSVTTFDGDGKAPSKGLFKKDAGEGDRIVLFDGDRRPILDMDYWILEEAHKPTNNCEDAKKPEVPPCRCPLRPALQSEALLQGFQGHRILDSGSMV